MAIPRRILFMSLALAILLGPQHSSASCFGKDAHFKTTDQPVITQPSKTEPTLVLVSWDKIIQRPECVDNYYVRVWPEGTDMAKGQKIKVSEKDPKSPKGKNVVTSKTVTIEPCVNTKFLIELEELDSITGKDLEKTGEQLFKSAAIPKISNLDQSRFQVTYFWDPVKKVVDLKQASVSFPKDMITFPSCLDYVQITGSQVASRTGPSLSRQNSNSPNRGRALEYLGGKPLYNPEISVGGASTLPGRISYSDVTRGSSGSVSRQSSSSSISSTGSTEPQFAYALPRPRGGATKKVGPIKATAPFLQPMISINIPVEDCTQYNFEVQFFSARKEIGKVQNLNLPPLADIPGYVPPPVTSVIAISFNTAGKPVYGVKTSSGVNAACLPAYFEAYDSYTQRLENEVGWQVERSSSVQSLVSSTKEELEKSQEELLKAQGCVCTSPHLELTTTDAKVLKKTEANQLGHYHFQGMHGGYPYFMKMAHDHAGPHSHAGHSHGSTGSAQTTQKPTVSAQTNEPMFLFYDTSKKQWRFAGDLGGNKNLFFATEEKSVAKCPGDPTAKGTWQAATGTFGRFKKNPNVNVACETNL
eukprot:TRINITY_DN3066_c0_g1_i10.p1 TRINITY_DN3066_c0_g1~~TRINITY_DN3066_c0_g1_i10.p1  ORF type:complete len:586 (-),score=167.47 TRINITY_DN3066_c0_g1_i10:160-1917(-)